MCEDYFLYFEELDWVMRGKLKNWKVDISFQSKVWHKEGGSINNGKKKSRLCDYFLVRSKIIITKRFFSLALPFVYLSMFWFIINRIRRKQFNRILFILKLCIHPYMPVDKVIFEATK